MGENISGKDVEARFMLGSNFLVMKFESVDVEEIGEEVQDDICGDERSEFQTIIDGYRIRFDNFFDENGKKLLAGFLRVRANDRTPLTQIKMMVGLRFKLHNGTTGVYRASQCTLDPFKINVPGKKPRVKLAWSLRAREFDEVA